MNPNLAWGAIIGLGFLYETYTLVSKKSGDTLSERIRTWFRTRTKTGRAVFTLSWVSFSAWFLVHILGG